VICVIGGTAGAGKTALAIQWAHQVAGQFPDGQLYVNLRGYDPGLPMPAGKHSAGSWPPSACPGCRSRPGPMTGRPRSAACWLAVGC
jgi:hypothetical protein